MNDDNLTAEDIRNLRSFKRSLFDLYWEKFGVFYLQVMPHPDLEIGKRGLINSEKEHGIVLVFGDKAVREIDSREDYLYAELQFGSRWESLIVPWDSIARIFDKFQNSVTQVRFLQSESIRLETKPVSPKEKPPLPTASPAGTTDNVIRIDFGGKAPK